nr:restriction endonuclease subunit S [Heyndrickxia acidiproducens]
MEQTKLVPKRRFKEFQNAHGWEQRELGKVVDLVKSYSLSRDVETDEDSSFRYVHYGDIHKKVADLIESDEQLPMIKAGDYESLQKGDVIVADASEDYTGIAEPAVLLNKPSAKVVAGLHTIAMRPKEITPLFLYYLLHTDNFKSYGTRVGTGMKVFGITTNNLFKYPAALPVKEEQEEIGKFFYDLDNLITLHQRKLDKTKALKSAYLTVMFPAEGERKPKRRFAGFTDSWEQCNLGDLMEISSASRVHKNEWTKSGVPFFRSSDVVSEFKGIENNKAYISQSLFEKLSIKSGRVKKGDVLVTGGGSIGIPYLVKNDNPLYFKDADLIWLKSSETTTNGNFLYTFFITPFFRNYVKSITHIGTISHYTIEQAKVTPIRIPTKKEQTKIGSFFANLDHLITLRKRKLEKLQNLKKAYLNEMFV